MIQKYSDYDAVYIYGAGNNGQRMASFLKSRNYPVQGFVDRNMKAGALVAGFPVFDIERFDYLEIKAHAPRCLVCVSVLNRACQLTDIREFLYQRHCTDISFALDFVAQFHQSFGSIMWLSGPKSYDYAEADIKQVEQLLEDSVSRDVFRQSLRVRQSFDIQDLPQPYPIEEQYFSADVPLKSYRSFVDAGAYDGDSIEALLAHQPQLETYIAFEPDHDNFKRLQVNAQRWMQDKRQILFASGLSDRSETLRFSDGVGESSRIDPNGSSAISVCALDSLTLDTPIDYIKMDIEGAEHAALLGAQATIRMYRPQLAICTYHHPEHMLSIPLLIESWQLGYKFYIRQYGYCGFDQVLYAIPMDINA